MPGGDRRGPRGQGRLSGRGAGYCAESNPAESTGDAQGVGGQYGGRGRARGRGQGLRRCVRASDVPFWGRAGAVVPQPEQELAGLKNEASWLQRQLEAIQRRIADLEKKE